MASTVHDPRPLVIVTGASGFIAKHTIHQLLEAGYRVRGTVLNDEEHHIALKAQEASSSKSRDALSLVTADLTQDQGWDEALKDCDYAIHLASPYPLKAVADRESLVPIAREGTLRVVQKAFDQKKAVRRVVVVSSILAMQYSKDRPRPIALMTEDSWTDPDWKAVPAYPVSKTRAEKALWEWCSTHPSCKDRVVVVNPGMVWGPMFDSTLSTSSEICRLIMTGAYPLIPSVGYGVVDVRDVAAVLIASLKAEKVGGRRLIATSHTIALEEVCRVLAKAFPRYKDKLPTRIMPFWLLWLASWFDKSLVLTLNDASTTCIYDTQYVTELTGVTFRPPEEAVCAMAQSLIDHGIV